MPLSFDGRVALVTGVGRSGLGLAKSPAARIINTASNATWGSQGDPGYATAKSGAIALTRGQASLVSKSPPAPALLIRMSSWPYASIAWERISSLSRETSQRTPTGLATETLDGLDRMVDAVGDPVPHPVDAEVTKHDPRAVLGKHLCMRPRGHLIEGFSRR